MGQRSQSFIKIKQLKYENGVTTIDSHISAFHCQWMYGSTFIQQIKNVLEFNSKASKYTAFNSDKCQLSEDEANSLIGSLISTNAKEGYYHNIISLNAEAKEYENFLRPDCQDNNDGQAFIDFTVTGMPKIGFAFPFEKDVYGGLGNTVIETIPAFKILTPREYYNIYYSKEEIASATSKSDIAFFKKDEQNIRWIENHTKMLTQEDFRNLYPEINS